MFTDNQKHIVLPEVYDFLPKEIIDGVWVQFETLLSYKAFVDTTAAVVFSDDFDDQNIFTLWLQNSGEFSQELALPYSKKDHSFLKKGIIAILEEKDDNVTMFISQATKENAKK